MKSDLISRQAAIDAIYALSNHTIAWIECAVGEIEALPSAQPEPCEDAVSRHRLLNDLEELTTAWGKYPVMAEQIKGVEAAIRYVEAVPSAQPEQSDAVYRLYKRAYEAGQRNPQPEVVCANCKHWVCHDRRCGYWNHGVKPMEWCCHAERREE